MNTIFDRLNAMELLVKLFALYKEHGESLIVSHTAWMPWWLCSVFQLIQTDEEDMETLLL